MLDIDKKNIKQFSEKVNYIVFSKYTQAPIAYT